MSGRNAKLIRVRMRWWFHSGLRDEMIARQLSASPEIVGDVPVRKVRRERARLINIHKRNEEKRGHENPTALHPQKILDFLARKPKAGEQE